MSNNVTLIEPNEVNTKLEGNNAVNAIPQYQDMHIFAELIAKSKSRTVVIINKETTSTDSETVNFIGNNQDIENNNPNLSNFTTNYYDGSTAGGKQFEGFGINNIKIKINSSFIPQIDIQFIDIRGLAFFNQNDSPYRILFDFPPPIFTLTVKGLYGKSITYDLHLVKYTSEFSATNGNFIIDAQFVAVTFAPLSDILFRYIVNTPLTIDEESNNANTDEKPRNTNELILKLKNLYSAIAKKLKTDTENQEYNTILKQIEAIDEIGDMFDAIIKGDSEILNAKGTPYLVSKTPSVKTDEESTESSNPDTLTIIETLSEFNDLIKSEETTGKKNILKNRLYIVYMTGTDLPLSNEEYNPFKDSSIYIEPIVDPYEYTTKNYAGVKTALDSFTKIMMSNVLPSFNVRTNDIATHEPFTNSVNIITNKNVKTQYYGMDITEYYYKLYKKNQKLIIERNELSTTLATKINNLVIQNLGMRPSIYNIFKIILDDVDNFFSILRKTSDDADYQHNISADVIKEIAGNNIDSPSSSGNIPDHIYPFPLIIDQSVVFGGTKQERVAPINLVSDTVKFPELDLVYKFMNTFLLQKKLSTQYDARANQNDDGTYKWLPISPYDSVLGDVTPKSPYLNVHSMEEMTKIFLKRFYILSQGSINNSFYGIDSNKRTAYIELYAKAEATNLISTLTTELDANNLRANAQKYKDKVDEFYKYAKTINTKYDDGSAEGTTGNLILFPDNDPKSFTVTPSNPDVGRVYTDKDNADFTGFNWYNDEIVIQDTDEVKGSSKPVDEFSSTAKGTFFNRIFRGNSAESIYYEFTQENVIFLRDINSEDDGVIDKLSDRFSETRYLTNVIIDGLSMRTRYLTDIDNNYWVDIEDSNYEVNNELQKTDNNGYERNSFGFPGGSDSLAGQKEAYQDGNIVFKPFFTSRDKRLLKKGDNVFNVWKSQLTNPNIVDILTGDTTNLSTVLILSNFGKTASPFNIFPNGLNELIFETPAAIEIPYYYVPYLGALLTSLEKTDEYPNGWVNEILTFFTGDTGQDGVGQHCPNIGYFVLADLHDVEKYLSDNDKEKCKVAYTHYTDNNHGDIVIQIIETVNDVRENTGDGDDKIFDTEQIGYNYLLNKQADDIKNGVNIGQSYYMIKILMERKSLINFSQITFEMKESYPDGYISIETLNGEDDDNKTANQLFFQTFFGTVFSKVKEKINKLKDEKEELKRAKGDKDIINQLYYSFKNINDKWLTGRSNDNKFYPYNKPKKDGGYKKLIDSFAFVDRAMNPIGDTMINAEILLDMLDDPNLSLFSVLSQLLSLNGFNFFPLQNFLNFDENGWKDSFKIYSSPISDTPSSAFVCMYIGGTSSYPSVTGNGFVNDGIIDISEPGVSDYSVPKPDADDIRELKSRDIDTLTEDEKQIINDDFPWQEVRAFKVRFGEQNQSMFTDIKIDSKEYTDTNESIQILSRLAGDENPNAQVPKGQNLYNLYENRSYKATVTGFGNAMIQPTQYFQLENIPLFNGAYIILDVEHNITANKMTTSFSGTKILKYPVPRVLNSVAFTNYNPNQSAGDVVVNAANAVSNRVETHYNSMYANNKDEKGNDITLKIE